jgi:HK97 family phage major capsid protein
MPNDVQVASLGRVQIRDISDSGRISGLAIPYGVAINIAFGRERFVRGAFAEMVELVNRGERVAYLNRHGIDGGVPIAAIDRLQERDEGLFFGGSMIDVPEAVQYRSVVASGIDGVSAEFVPGQVRRKGDLIEHYAGVRLAGIAGSYAPAYREARVALRSVARATERGKMPNLSVAALTERRDALRTQVATIRGIAETEDRALDESETTEIATIEGRLTNVDALIQSAEGEAERRDAERRSLPSQPVGAPARVTRAETVYGPGQPVSYFGDLVAATMNRDAEAIQRQNRHRAMVADIASQIERRAVDSSDIAGAYPTSYYPDLYVPDIAYTGPLAGFFATTPIAAPNPIIVPAFATVTGDTGVQGAENDALANVDVTTAPKTLTPKSIGGETIVSRQSVDGASPGTDVIIGNELRELLMRDTEREIALVLEALTASGTITDTAGTTPASAGRDLYKGLTAKLGEYYAGANAGGAGARMLPAEGVFVNSKDWQNLVQGEDTTGRPLMPYISPMNSQGQITAVGFQRGVIGGVPVEPAWAILSAITEIVARRNDARQWKSTALDVRLMEREGPQSVVFAVFQYFGFAVLEPKGVRKYTYTNV